MKIKLLDGEKLYYAFFYGRKEVLKKRKHLNAINVFPVPDGDTGTNLALTMQSIVDGARAVPDVSDVSQSMAEAALLGSRGNSGIIFGQFVHGLSEAMRGKKVLNPKEFTHAMRNGVEHAYKALSKPVEGTILTVMKAWANALHSAHEKASDFTELMHHALEAAKHALRETPKKLKVLEKAGVVDAGAEGFVHFLEGALRFLRHGRRVDAEQDVLEIAEDDSPDFADGNLTYRYCTETLMEGDIDSEAVRSLAAPFGDSLIVAGHGNRVKLHIHTNTPQELFYQLRQSGAFVQQKVDDMKRQYEVQHARNSRIALVTDSTCDLPQEILDQYQIHVIPLTIQFGDSGYLDGVALSPDRFYAMLDDEEEYPLTSQPPMKTFQSLYDFLSKHYRAIVSLHLSGALSGTFEAAKLAAKKITRCPISVNDSKTLSSALGLMVQRVAEEIESGRSFEEVVRLARTLSERVDLLVAVKTLKYLIRGGRVSPLKGVVAKALNLKPIISIDSSGASMIRSKAFSEKGSIQKILKLIKRIHARHPISRFAVGHSLAGDEALRLEESVASIVGRRSEFNVNIAPVIGVHAGVGAVSVSFLSEE